MKEVRELASKKLKRALKPLASFRRKTSSSVAASMGRRNLMKRKRRMFKKLTRKRTTRITWRRIMNRTMTLRIGRNLRAIKTRPSPNKIQRRMGRPKFNLRKSSSSSLKKMKTISWRRI